MPTLDWIGKQAVVNHHREVPYRLLQCDKSLSVGDPEAGNLLVQGDNLEALKALLPYYAGKIKCIYIDPPYNTGNEAWIYNDNTNAPEISAWINKVVGKNSEDLSRHDKWLCMMYPRLRLLREFLSEDGIIFVSIDENEYNNLSILMNEIFGNKVATFIWKRRQTPDSRNKNGVSEDHEYIICHGGKGEPVLRGAAKDLEKYTNHDDDHRGPWMSDNLTGLADASERPNLHYTVTNPADGKSYPPHERRGWAVGPERMRQLIDENKILWPKSSAGRPRIKRFLADLKSDTTGFSTFIVASANIAGTKELNDMFGYKAFPFPKPRDLIEQIIEQSTVDGDYILDSFAGTGTTGHAALNINKKMNANRKFILVEMDTNIAEKVTYQRLKMAVEGYASHGTGERIPALEGGFTFCRLGAALLNDDGLLHEDVKFSDLAAHVFFCETGNPIPKRAISSTSLIGLFQDRAIYLLLRRDDDAQSGEFFDLASLAALPDPHHNFTGPRVVYAEGCTIPPERLAAHNVTFKQIPYQIAGL